MTCYESASADTNCDLDSVCYVITLGDYLTNLPLPWMCVSGEARRCVIRPIHINPSSTSSHFSAFCFSSYGCNETFLSHIGSSSLRLTNPLIQSGSAINYYMQIILRNYTNFLVGRRDACPLLAPNFFWQ